MAEQIERNQFSNVFDYFQALIEEYLKNQSLTISQRLEAPIIEQAKTMAEQVQQAKAIHNAFFFLKRYFVTPLLRSDPIGESEPDPGCSLNCDAPNWGSVIS